MNTILKQVLEKHTGYRKSLPDMLKLITDNRRSDADEAFKTRLNALASWCFSCGHEIGVLEGFEAGNNGTQILQEAHTNVVTKEEPPHWGFLSYDEACCSKCGFVKYTGFYTTNEAIEKWSELPKFCENCGAKMDLDIRSGFPKKRKSKG